MKLARIVAVATALVLVFSALSFGTAFATTNLVDQRADVELMASKMAPVGAMGTAELRLIIDEEGMLDLFRARVDAVGLLADTTYSFWVGYTLIGSGMSDGNGSLSIDEELDTVSFKCLKGLWVKVVEGTDVHGTKVLFGKVTELERNVIADVEEEEVN